MATLRPMQPGRTDMVPGHLRPFRLMEFPDPQQRDTDGQGGRQVGTGYPFRDSGDPPPYLPSRLRAQDDGYPGDPSVPQPYRQSHMTSRQRTQEGGYPSDPSVPQPQMKDLRPHYQKTGMKDIGEATPREGKQARKEFFTQAELQQKTSRRSTSRDSSDSSSSDRHRRSRKRKDKTHKKMRRHQRHGGSSNASLDRNWRRKDKGRTLNVSKLSSEDSGWSTWTSGPSVTKAAQVRWKATRLAGVLFPVSGTSMSRQVVDQGETWPSFGLPERESCGLYPESALIWTAWLLHSAGHAEQQLRAGGAAYHCRKTASVPETRGNRDAGWFCRSSPHQGHRGFPRCQRPSAPRAGSGELSEGMPWQGCSIHGCWAESGQAQWSHAGPQISVCQLKGLWTFEQHGGGAGHIQGVGWQQR